MSGIVNNAIPGFNGLSGSATGIIGNLMGGLPSAAPTQRSNAYFGVNSGMPGSDFVRNRGFDLYGEQAQQNQQRGFDDFLKLLQGYSGTVMPTQAEQIGQNQFAQNLSQKQYEFNTGQYNTQRQINMAQEASRLKNQIPSESNNFTGGGDFSGSIDAFGRQHTSSPLGF